MDIALFVVAAVAIIAVSIIFFKYGFSSSLFALVLLTLALVPRRVIALGALDSDHAGITTSAVLVSSFTVVVVIGAIYLTGQRLLRIPLPFILFVILTGILMEPAWGASSSQISGWVHISIAILAWGVGYGFAQKLELNGPTSTQWAQIIAFILLGQLVIVVITQLGIALPTIVTLTDKVGARAVGTVGNPAILSKITFLLLIILLPLTTSTLRATRRWAWVGIALCLVLAGLTVSRANMVAVAVLAAVWALLVPGRVSLQVRLAIITLGAAAVYFFAGPFIERMDADESGTLRPMLMDAALIQIDQTPWFGVGINSYVEHVGQWDAVTASGFPVHNTFMLMVAEVGIPLAVVFFSPFAFLAWNAFRARKAPGARGAFAWATLGSLPGLVVIMVTGWGMLSGFTLVLWMLVSGIVDAQIRRPPEDDAVVLLTGAEPRKQFQPLR